jgi:hypothetical protein
MPQRGQWRLGRQRPRSSRQIGGVIGSGRPGEYAGEAQPDEGRGQKPGKEVEAPALSLDNLIRP